MAYSFYCDRCGEEIDGGVFSLSVIPGRSPGPVIRNDETKHLCTSCNRELAEWFGDGPGDPDEREGWWPL